MTGVLVAHEPELLPDLGTSRPGWVFAVGERTKADGAVGCEVLWRVEGGECLSLMADRMAELTRDFGWSHRLVMVSDTTIDSDRVDEGRLFELMTSHLAGLGRELRSLGIEVSWDARRDHSVAKAIADHAESTGVSIVALQVDDDGVESRRNHDAFDVVRRSNVPVLLVPRGDLRDSRDHRLGRPPVPEPSGRGRRRRRWFGATLTAFLVAGMTTLQFGSYHVERPGQAVPTDAMVDIAGRPRAEGEGRFLLLTVERERVSGIEVLRSWFDGDADVHSGPVPIGGSEAPSEQMGTSQTNAVEVALAHVQDGGSSRAVSTEMVSFDVGEVDGPSGGLALTLTLIDRLVADDLTGGKVIGVTGTIDADGRIGAVSGLRQKLAAARSAGAEVVIVPSSTAIEAIEHAGGLQVFAVDDLGEALNALEIIGSTDSR